MPDGGALSHSPRPMRRGGAGGGSGRRVFPFAGPVLETELWGELKVKADAEAIGVFAANLRELLLAPPLGPAAFWLSIRACAPGPSLSVWTSRGTSFLISETSPEMVNGGRFEEGYLADGVISLKLQSIGESDVQRRIRAVKLRSTNHKTGYFSLLFSESKFRATQVITE